MKYLLLFAMLSPFCVNAQIRFSKLYDYNNQSQIGVTVLEIQSGGYLTVSKNIGPEYSDNKLLLHRLDAFGNVLWQKEIYSEGFIYYLDYGAMLRLPDGNYLLGGDIKEISTELSDAFLIKIDTSGNVLWEKKYGTSDKNDFFGNFAFTPDSTHIQACGQTRRTDPAGNIWLFKTDLEGELVWDKEISSSGWQHGQQLAMLSDGSFYVAVRYGTSSLYQYKVYKFDASGNTAWQKKVGTNYDDSGYPKVVALPDDSALFIGSVGTSNWQVHHAYAAKLSPSGDIVWEKTHHTGFSSYAFAQPVVLPDGSAVLSGSVYLDNLNWDLHARFWKIDADGEIIWDHIYYSNPNTPNYIYHQIGTFDTGLTGIGSSHGTTTKQDTWILKLDSEGCLVENCTVSATEPEEEAIMNIYPNPATEGIFVQLPDGFKATTWDITDVLGRVRQLVATQTQEIPVSIDVSQLPAGLYWLRAFDAGRRMSVRSFQVIR
jgi:hypothetical protein